MQNSISTFDTIAGDWRGSSTRNKISEVAQMFIVLITLSKKTNNCRNKDDLWFTHVDGSAEGSQFCPKPAALCTSTYSSLQSCQMSKSARYLHDAKGICTHKSKIQRFISH